MRILLIAACLLLTLTATAQDFERIRVTGVTDADIKAALQQEYNIYSARLGTFQLLPFDAILGKSLIGATWEESQ